MGADAYCYFAPYEADVARALASLRRREFEAGRYNPALQAADPPTYTFLQRFPPDPGFPSPGARHGSVEEAFANGLETGSGTGSILDIQGLAASAQPLHASPCTHESLVALFGHSNPDHEEVVRLLIDASGDQLMKALTFWDEIGRGEARYFPVYAGGVPTEIFFCGMSID